MDFQDVLRFYSVNELVDDGFVDIEAFSEMIAESINCYQGETIFDDGDDVSFTGTKAILKMMSKEQLVRLNLIHTESLTQDYINQKDEMRLDFIENDRRARLNK